MPRKTPLAWFQLLKEKGSLSVALAGIAFADVLMFVQFGLLDALYDSSTEPHKNLSGDLVLLNRQAQTMIDLKSFPKDRLQQTKAYEGVDSVNAVYLESASLRNPETLISRSILVWGIDPVKPPFSFAHLKPNFEQLKLLDRMLFDRASRPEYGPVAERIDKEKSLEVQVNDKTVQGVGLFQLGASFGADGNIIISDTTFVRLFRDRSLNEVDIGLIKLKPDANKDEIKAQLQDSLPHDVKVLTMAEFINKEIEYWASQGTGFIFQLGVAVGFVVGVIIVYQILYANVSEHLPQYATLKAMGYSDGYLLTMLMQQSLILAVLGFLPGFVVSIGLYQLTYAATLLPVVMKLERALMVLGLTILMCGISGVIAMRKLQAADPADIF